MHVKKKKKKKKKVAIYSRHGVIKKEIVINYNLITFSKIIECNCNLRFF